MKRIDRLQFAIEKLYQPDDITGFMFGSIVADKDETTGAIKWRAWAEISNPDSFIGEYDTEEAAIAGIKEHWYKDKNTRYYLYRNLDRNSTILIDDFI